MSHRVIILNDTRRELGHLGCLTVMSNLLHLCERHGLEVVAAIEPVDALSSGEFQRQLALADMVLVNGEGTMHHDAPGALALARAVRHAREAGKVTALVNSVWQENRALNDYLRDFDHVAVRDSLSLQECLAGGASRPLLAPDYSLLARSEPPDLPARRRIESMAPCLITDSVFQPLSQRLYNYAAEQKLPFRYMVSWFSRSNLARYPMSRSRHLTLAELRTAPVVITGRFHGVCLAMRHGVPFLTLSSNTHKVEALLKDAGLPEADFLLPSDWDRRDSGFWIEHARRSWEKHQSAIDAFLARASAEITASFGAFVASHADRPIADSVA